MASRLNSELERAIKVFYDALDQEPSDDESNRYERDDSRARKTTRKASEDSLKRIVNVVRDACSAASAGNVPDDELVKLVRQASDAESEILDWAYGSSADGGGYDFFPLYSGNLVSDRSAGPAPRTETMRRMFLRVMSMGGGPGAAEVLAQMRAAYCFVCRPHDPTLSPSNHTTRLASFHAPLGSLPGANTSTLAIREARCETQTINISNPIHIALGTDVVAVQSAGGWKERDPVHQLIKLGINREDYEWSTGTIDPGHIDVCHQLAVDSSPRHLVWTADEHRIKSLVYTWDDTDPDVDAVHTFRSKGYDGPIALLNDGARLLRAGPKGIAVWNVDGAPTHPNGTGRIGGKISSDLVENSSREMYDAYIEDSKGSPPTTRIQFANGSAMKKGRLNLRQWIADPSHPNSAMICATGSSYTTYAYAVYRLDLETGRETSRYLGHGAWVNDFSTTPADPNVFLTSSNEGGVRLYDVRTAVPSITLYSAEEPVESAALFSSGGGLYAFAGGSRSQQIKLWDIRGKAALYELATGNNQVRSLGWDQGNTTLYAATECLSEDRHGYRHDYRRAKIPKWARAADSIYSDSDPGSGDAEVENLEDEDSDDGESRGWPTDASHDEFSFGYALDAGNSRLFRYAFKSDADITVLPEYGDAEVGDAERAYGMGW